MGDVLIRREGRAGRVTLTRAGALNALTHEMCLAIDAALVAWAGDRDVALVIIDAEGERAFCAGGDIAYMHATGRAGDHDASRRFFRAEYRMNRRLAEYRKPIVSLMHGFVMGGGVGLGCHVSHRVVGDTTRMAMPECAIGMVPDVGGSLLLARAPGRLGEYLGLSGARMGPGDAIHAGFADHFMPDSGWPELIAKLCATGSAAFVEAGAVAPPASPLALDQAEINAIFAQESVPQIMAALEAATEDRAGEARKAMARGSPLSLVCTLALLRGLDPDCGIDEALAREFRYTWRATEMSDFLEGVRAQIIDKDRRPRWKHPTPGDVTEAEVAAMLAPLGEAELWVRRQSADADGV